MIERLREVVAQAERLSEQEQESLATAWEAALEEREWERIVSKPEVRNALRRMAAEAIEEDAAGETEETLPEVFANL